MGGTLMLFMIICCYDSSLAFGVALVSLYRFVRMFCKFRVLPFWFNELPTT